MIFFFTILSEHIVLAAYQDSHSRKRVDTPKSKCIIYYFISWIFENFNIISLFSLFESWFCVLDHLLIYIAIHSSNFGFSLLSYGLRHQILLFFYVLRFYTWPTQTSITGLPSCIDLYFLYLCHTVILVYVLSLFLCAFWRKHTTMQVLHFMIGTSNMGKVEVYGSSNE